MCGKRYKRWDICSKGGENHNRNTRPDDYWNPRVAYPERDDLRWEELTAQDMILMYWYEKHKNIQWHFKIPVGPDNSKIDDSRTV